MEYKKVKDSKGREYLISPEGLFYSEGTPEGVIAAIDLAYRDHLRVLLTQGDIKTGVPWGEEHDVEGYIGRSSGPVRIPLLIHNTRSTGGGGILTHCILRIRHSQGLNLIYQADNIKPLKVTVKPNADHKTMRVLTNGKLYAPHVTPAQAKRLERVLS